MWCGEYPIAPKKNPLDTHMFEVFWTVGRDTYSDMMPFLNLSSCWNRSIIYTLSAVEIYVLWLVTLLNRLFVTSLIFKPVFLCGEELTMEIDFLFE